MPEYLIEVKNKNHGRKRKEKVFASCCSEAEKMVKIARGEILFSVSNCSFTMDSMKARKR
jgi:hypothetical protein|tara:strand:- start:855 stop:1034 length:180 start_codon:yes stop_codon:yes gene_type:complete